MMSFNTTLVVEPIGEFNFSKNPLTFSRNMLVNCDFCVLINHINNRNYIELKEIMTRLHNDTQAFYSADMKKELLKLLDSYLIIRRAIQRIYNKTRMSPKRVNELNLSLLPISPNNSLDIVINNAIYCFDVVDLLKIYRYSVHDISGDLYLSGDIKPPRNPYTNIPFSLKENVIIYNAFKKYYISIGRSIPIYLEKLKSAYFDIELYLRYNFDFLMSKSVGAYISNLSKREFKIEFMTMIYSSLVTKNNYCRRCYNKYNLPEIFSKTLLLYILNSNNIFVFGNYIECFGEVVERNNLILKKNHNKLHRRRIRKYRQCSNYITTSESLNTHPMAI